MEPDGRFLCEHDYQQTREKCDHCKLPLLDRVLTAMDRKFHPACFRCGLCDIALEGVPFLISGGSVNCQPCYTKYKAAQCVRCNKGIVSTGSAKTSLVTCQVSWIIRVDGCSVGFSYASSSTLYTGQSLGHW